MAAAGPRSHQGHELPGWPATQGQRRGAAARADLERGETLERGLARDVSGLESARNVTCRGRFGQETPQNRAVSWLFSTDLHGGEPPMARERALSLGASGARSWRAAGDDSGSTFRRLSMRLFGHFHALSTFLVGFRAIGIASRCSITISRQQRYGPLQEEQAAGWERGLATRTTHGLLVTEEEPPRCGRGH